MPVTNSLGSIGGTTLFTGNALTFTPNYSGNYVDIAGCTDSWAADFATQLYLYSIVNPA